MGTPEPSPEIANANTAAVVDLATKRKPRPQPEPLGAVLDLEAKTIVVPAAGVDRVKDVLVAQLRACGVKGFKNPAKAPAALVIARRGREKFERELDLVVFDAALREVADGLPADVVVADPVEVDGRIAADAGTHRVFHLNIERDVVDGVVFRDLVFDVPTPKPVTTADVDACIDGHRRRFTEICPLAPGEAITTGDAVVVSLKADVDGRENPLVIDNALVVVGSNKTAILGLEAACAGHLVGDVFRGRFSWPEVFEPMPVLAGAAGDFDVVVVSAKRRHVPEVDSEFALMLGNHASVEAMRQAIAEDLAECAADAAKNAGAANAIDAMLAANRERLTPAASAVDRAYAAMVADAEAAARSRGQTRDQFVAAVAGDVAKWHDAAKANAVAVAAITRGLRSIAVAEGYVVDDAEITAFFERVARGTSEPPDVYRKRFVKEGRMRAVRDEILRQRAIAAITATRAVPAETSSA